MSSMQYKIKRRNLFFKLITPSYKFIRKPKLERLIKVGKDNNCDVVEYFVSKLDPPKNYPFKYFKFEDNVALLSLDNDYEFWWNKVIDKKARNMIRKAKKNDLRVEIKKDLNKKDLEYIEKIYNETPIRQGRWSPYFGKKPSFKYYDKRIFLTAYRHGKMIGFLILDYDERFGEISTILSLKSAFKYAPNNFLVSECVKFCYDNNIKCLTYGRMNLPSLNFFKRKMGFKKFLINRLYVPLTKLGDIGCIFGICRKYKDLLPISSRNLFLPIYNVGTILMGVSLHAIRRILQRQN